MRKYIDSVSSAIDGRPVNNAEVRVYLTSTGAAAQLYSADNLAATIGQPLYTDGFGEFSFYVADGIYDFAINGDGPTRIRTGVEISDPATAEVTEAGITLALGAQPATVPMLTNLASANMSNVGGYDVVQSPQIGAVTVSPNWEPHYDAGVGPAAGRQFWHYPRIAMDLGGAGASWTGLGISGNVGGPTLNAVPELMSSYLYVDVPSPNCTNPNAVAMQARVIGNCDGRVAGTDHMALIPLASFCGGGPSLTYSALGAIEADVGSNSAVPTGLSDAAAKSYANLTARGAYSAVGIGIQKGGADNDAAYVITQGPQYVGGYQQNYPGTEGFEAGFLIHNRSAAPGFNQPIAKTGGVLKIVGGMDISYGIDVSQANIAGAVLRSRHNVMTETSTTMDAPNHILSLGAQTTANNPTIYLYSSGGGTANPDVGISAGGGTGAGVFTGAMIVQASNLRTPSLEAGTDNQPTLGSASRRYATAYLGSNPIVGSDAKLKTDIQSLSALGDKFIHFWSLLDPCSFVYRDIVKPEATTFRTERRPKKRIVSQEQLSEVEMPDGTRALRITQVDVEVDVTGPVAVLNADGTPMTERRAVAHEPTTVRTARTRPRTDADGVPLIGVDGKPEAEAVLDEAGRPIYDEHTVMRAVMADVPMMQDMPVYEDVAVPVMTEAVNIAHDRRHIGLIAQQVRAAIATAGLDDDRAERSIWAMFVHDPDAVAPDGTPGLFMLRYEQFVAVSIFVTQHLMQRVTALESAA